MSLELLVRREEREERKVVAGEEGASAKGGPTMHQAPHMCCPGR